jgi:hypothetical protein
MLMLTIEKAHFLAEPEENEAFSHIKGLQHTFSMYVDSFRLTEDNDILKEILCCFVVILFFYY